MNLGSITLPIDVASEAIGILATRGAGKSFTSAVEIEELWGSHIQFAVLDPTGVYWGLRASADGTGDGLPVIVLGGAHGDIPLEPTGGALVADLLIDTGQSLILDLSDFPTKAAQTRFVTDFAERLYRGKARSRSTLHLVVDEADEFAPQRHGPGEARMVGAMEALVRRGRSRGIGITLITQRSATLNKNVLDLVDTLIAMRIGGPRDRAVVQGWITSKDLRDELSVLESLPSLKTGTGWIWSPVRGILEKLEVRRIRTFDSYATPKPGQVRIEPKQLAPIDLAALGAQMAATVERVRSEDPKELRKRIAELERAKPEPEIQRIEVPILDDVTVSRLESIAQDIVGLGKDLLESANGILAVIRERAQIHNPPARIRANIVAEPLIGESTPSSANRLPEPRIESGISKPWARVLSAIAWFESVGIPAPRKDNVAVMAGYAPNTGTINNYFGALRAADLVHYPGGCVALTDLGRTKVDIPPPGSLDDLHAAWLSKLSGPQAKILRLILSEYPNPLPKDHVAVAAGYAPNTGTINTYFGSLRSLGVVDYPSTGYIVAADILFPEGLR